MTIIKNVDSAGFSNYTELLSDFKKTIELGIEGLLSTIHAKDPLRTAVSYTLGAGGKRIRPILMMSVLHDIQEDAKQYLNAALAVELLHIASLIHDDLPALDNDDLRRGRKTCHKEFNEATAILTADYMIALAFKQLSLATVSQKVFPDAVSILSKAFQDLCSGQQFDLTRGQGQIDNALIAQLKTGALFSTTFSIAMLIAELPKYIISLAEETGLHVGVCYQICDDFADSVDAQNLKGRADNSDQRNAKQTFSSEQYAEEAMNLITLSKNKIVENLDKIAGEIKLKNNFHCTKAALNSLFAPFEKFGLTF